MLVQTSSQLVRTALRTGIAPGQPSPPRGRRRKIGSVPAAASELRSVSIWCRIIMLQEVSGLMDTRTNGYWDYWMLGLLDTRTIGYRNIEYWTIGNLTAFDT